MAKRKAESSTDAPPPAKKGGFRGMDCPFSKSDFLAKAADTTMTLVLQPKTFASGRLGYHKSGGIAQVEADGPDSQELGDKIAYVRPSCIANIFGAAAGGKVLPSAEEFMKVAKPLEVTFVISPVEFSTGSIGWMAHRKQHETVAGSTLILHVNFNAPIVKSKEKGDAEEDPAIASIDPHSIKHYIPTIGAARPEDKNDLTKIRGIGPWIEKRLNKLGIFTFKQISKMTPEIEEAVNDAIKYLKGRVHRDEWVLQSRKIVGGKWEELNPIVSRATGQITIGGEKYERKLIEIARDAMADGHIEYFEAEALWFSAADGNRITPLERKTLQYIMISEDYKVDDEAQVFLMSKLSFLDGRGVMTAGSPSALRDREAKPKLSSLDDRGVVPAVPAGSSSALRDREAKSLQRRPA